MGKDRSKVYRVSFELFDPRNETSIGSSFKANCRRRKR